MDPEYFCYWLINKHISENELSLLFPEYNLVIDDDEVYLEESIEEERKLDSIDFFHLEHNSIICFSSSRLFYKCTFPDSILLTIKIMKAIGSSVENKFHASIYNFLKSDKHEKMVDFYYENGDSSMDSKLHLSDRYQSINIPFEVIYELQMEYFNQEITQEDPYTEGNRFFLKNK